MAVLLQLGIYPKMTHLGQPLLPLRMDNYRDFMLKLHLQTLSLYHPSLQRRVAPMAAPQLQLMVAVLYLPFLLSSLLLELFQSTELVSTILVSALLPLRIYPASLTSKSQSLVKDLELHRMLL